MQLNLIKQSWEEVYPKLQSINPELAKIVVTLKLNPQHKVFTVRLPFGTQVFREGELNPLLVHEDLIPIGMVLHNQLELYLGGKRPLPFWVLKPGDILGGSQLINQYFQGDYQPAFCWDVTSGLRSVFLLAKINNATRLNKLYRHYQSLERMNMDNEGLHWQLFRNLMLAEQNPWYSELLFFSKAWFSHIDNPAWNPFYLFIIGEAMKKLAFVRDNLRWQYIFSQLHEQKFARYSEYVMSTVKHLFALGSSALPGFAPISDDAAMPLARLQQIFHDLYQLEYQPIFMGAVSPNVRRQHLYYSLQYPALIDSAPRLSRISNAEVLEQIIHIASRCFNYFKDPYYARVLPMLHRFATEGAFEYYHHLAKPQGMIHNVYELFARDAQFSAASACSELGLPVNASFLKGCIKITPIPSVLEAARIIKSGDTGA